MGLPNKLYFLLTVAWWILLMGFGSCTSGLSISLFHFSALLIFHLGSCPQPRILSQPWSPWWALPTSPGLSVTSWGWPCLGGELTAHPGTDLRFHEFVWQKCQSWCCSVEGFVTGILGDSLGGSRSLPPPGTALLTLHSPGCAEEWTQPALLSDPHWGCSEEEKTKFYPPQKGLDIKWAESFWKRWLPMNFCICCSRLLTLTHHSLDLHAWHVHHGLLQWELLGGGRAGVIRLLVPPLVPFPNQEWHLATARGLGGSETLQHCCK